MSSKQRSKRKRFDSCNSKLQQIDPASKEQVHKLFDKTFSYTVPTDVCWKIESTDGFELTETMVEMKKDLDVLKERLNNVKDSLSDKDIVSWHHHTKFMHIAGGIMHELKTAFHVELCTQAWCKFYEILNKFPIIPENCTEINSVHLCEAPGAFVSALNHQLKYRELQNHWQWVASTLCPYHEGNSLNYMIDDDWFIRETLDHWYFGQDGTGNLMNKKNIQALVDKVSHMNGIQLITADGSIGCQNSPAEQELLVSDLHYYETLSSLKLLEVGGSFVIKIFTMFEERTITLLYLLNTTFKQVSVFKPSTSKPGNSEVYIICEHYTAQLTSDTFQQIFDNEFEVNKPLYPESFLKQHVSCCQQFVNYQIEAIEVNIHTYKKLTTEDERWQTSLKEYCQELFITKYNLRRIPEYSQIITNKYSKVSIFNIF
ncbi:hypothetical protein LOTGIDRAFT_139267 [Lottia gigantea]|uniref:Cap-specific mRNA (nucleoside-2'-O-)-methyltransferase 2 n=1 Tax=Lottia gigantea TaxID=225164 RepID=V4B6I9_LOTGI|nr:hypothetical protein LOTGIDRAFT_139267 [Lottia gigantea]ESP01692.1 hypothetical protein LOTGIDRAFT_139267 [Lottia gigantea]